MIERAPRERGPELHGAVKPTDHLALIQQFSQTLKQQRVFQGMEGGLDLLEIGANCGVLKAGAQIGALHAITALHLAGLVEMLMPCHQGGPKR